MVRAPWLMRMALTMTVAAAWGGGSAAAQNGLFGQPTTQTFIAPDRLFAVELPTSWQVVQAAGVDEFQFMPSGPGDPMMYVRRLAVPAGADPMHVALRAIDDRLSKMPGFRLTSKRRALVAGHKAASVTGAYQYQGNAQYPRAVEEVFIVSGAEAFVFHFDVMETVAGNYVAQLNRFYQSFVPRPGTAPQVLDDAAEPQPEIKKIPF